MTKPSTCSGTRGARSRPRTTTTPSSPPLADTDSRPSRAAMIGLDRHCRRRSHYVIVASPLLPQRFGAQDAVLSTAERSSFSADHTVSTPHNKLSLVFSPGFPLINSSSCFDCMYPIRLSWPFSTNLTSQPSSTSQKRNAR